MNLTPTQHPEVNTLLAQLQETLQPILGDQLVGMYLFGSLTSGTFDAFSDIDILVVTTSNLTEDRFQALKAAHEQIAASGSYWATQLEVAYIPADDLRRFDPNRSLAPHIDRGEGEVLHWENHEEDWIIQRYNLRESGKVVIGPEPASLIDPVSTSDLRSASLVMLHKRLTYLEAHPNLLDRRGGQSYAVLTLCRILYALENEAYITKPAAVEWARGHLDQGWLPLVERAWAGRQQPEADPPPGDVAATWDFLHYALERYPLREMN